MKWYWLVLIILVSAAVGSWVQIYGRNCESCQDRKKRWFDNPTEDIEHEDVTKAEKDTELNKNTLPDGWIDAKQRAIEILQMEKSWVSKKHKIDVRNKAIEIINGWFGENTNIDKLMALERDAMSKVQDLSVKYINSAIFYAKR